MPDLRALLQALTPEVPLPQINTATGANGIDAAGNVWVYQPPDVELFQAPGAPFLSLSGGQMQGPLLLAGPPVLPLGAATKSYVDAILNSPNFTGTPTAPTTPVASSDTTLATTAFVHAVVASGGTFVDAPADGTSYGRLNNNWAGVLPLTGGALTGALSVQGANPLNLTGLNGSTRNLFWQTAGVNRWSLTAFQGETGANSGADFSISRYNDAGTQIDSPMSITRSTGQLGFGNVTTGSRVEINAQTLGTGMATGVLYINRNAVTTDNQAPQFNSYVNVSHSSGNLYANQRIATLVSGNTPTWAIWNYTACQANTDATWVVGLYNQQVRNVVNPGGQGRGVGLWSEVDEVRSTTGLPSSQDGLILPVEIDIFANGLDDLTPQIGRTHLSIVLGQHDTAGTPVVASCGISFYVFAGSQGWWKSCIFASAAAYAALDTRGASIPTGITNPFAAVRLAQGQIIDFSGFVGPSMLDNTTPGRWLQYTSTGTARLRYMSGATELWSIADTGAVTQSGALTAASLNGTPIGSTTPSTGTFTTLTANTGANVGQGSGQPNLNINGANTGAGYFGPALQMQFGGTTRGGLFGYSAFFGGTFSDQIVLAAASGLNFALAGTTRMSINANGYLLIPNLVNAANDAAAATGGVPLTGVYRNGSVLMVRVA